MRLLDLFCGAGGAAMGYHLAGFEVVGVDIDPQPNYPFAFHQADALTFPLTGFDAVHASPPCQAYSTIAKQHGKQYPDLVAETRNKLAQWGGAYVIENVPGAPLVNPTMLCGATFDGLRVIRHRMFETNWTLPPRPCPPTHPRVFSQSTKYGRWGNQDTDFITVTGNNCTTANRQDAMGITWMKGRELSEAIPPAYTQYVGTHLSNVTTTEWVSA